MTAESAEEDSGKMLKCSQCPKEFRYKSERNRHEMSHLPRFECEVCCKKFSFVSALRRHQKQHERTGSVKCEECKRKFRDELLLKRHMKYAHKGTYTCSECSTQFSSDQALGTHMKTHKPKSERRFKCSFEGCGKSFNFSHHLKHHELTHTNAKQHYCSVCGKGFIQSHHLKTHMKSHNPSEWLHCEFSGCKKKFSTEYTRKRHMATHKNKPDSGISSDSNSCDASISSKECMEDLILCASCGENIPNMDFSKHSRICGDVNNNSDNEYFTVRPIEEKHIIIDKSLLSARHILEKDIDDCKSALGGCITNGNNCVCAQMSKPIEQNYDFTPLGNFEDPVMNEINNNINFNEKHEKYLKNIDYDSNYTVLNSGDTVDDYTDVLNNVENYNPIKKISTCEGCVCANGSNIRESSNCNKNIYEDTVSNVEYRDNGVVKIKDTFDMDIPIKVDGKITREPLEFVPFSTCRDVVGNCLAGGNENCLCAKMMMDDQQAMAQEIDDITPKPKTENFIML